MAGHPAPPAVTIEVVEGDLALERWVEPASRLITAEFPRPAMQITPGMLRWHLIGLSFDGVHPVAATAMHDGELVGFAAATPRPLACGRDAAVAYVVSFVCAGSRTRGIGVASRLYDALLDAIRQRAGRVLTFAIDQSAGMHALESAYPRHGFTAQSLGSLPPYAVMRGRIAAGSAPAVKWPAPVLALARNAGVRRHLDCDPRGSALVGDGARVVAARRVTDDAVEPLLLLEELPEHLDADTLRAALRGAFDRFPDHGKLLVVPNFPSTGAELARAVGLRRLAGPVYRAWLWCRDAGDPLLRARSTSHPVL